MLLTRRGGWWAGAEKRAGAFCMVDVECRLCNETYARGARKREERRGRRGGVTIRGGEESDWCPRLLVMEADSGLRRRLQE